MITRIFQLMCIILLLAGCGINSKQRIPEQICISPDGSKIAFSALGDIYIMNLDGSQVIQLTKSSYWEGLPSFSYDGRYIVYVRKSKIESKGSQICVIKADGSSFKQVTQYRFMDTFPSFSPDGSKIVFVRAHWYRPYSMGGYRWDDFDVYVVSADGSNERRLTKEGFYAISPPRFSPDGQKIVFSAETDQIDHHEIFLLEKLNSQKEEFVLKRLTSSACYNAEPAFSWDGRLIVFISDRTCRYNYEIWVMDRKGKFLRQITNLNSYCLNPIFAPDNENVFFLFNPEAGQDEDYELWQVNIYSKKLQKILESFPIP
ncbi:MAG: hypothetical protein NZ937_03010 [Armatimonadetes bacterium]|nr:hypothetical protein [Armatimonadota bacterium]